MSAPSVAEMRTALGLGSDVSDAAVVDAYVASLGFGITVRPTSPAASDPFAAAAAALFRAPGSVAAIYTTKNGDTISTRAIRGQPDAVSRFGGASIVQATNGLQLLRGDVPAPQAGDQIVIGQEVLTITGEPMLDDERVSWNCTTDPA